MNVINRLPGVRPLVEHHSIASFGHPLLAGDVVRGGEDATEQSVVVELRDGLHVRSGHDQEVNRRLGVEVGEGHDVVIAVKGFELRVGNQPAEDAVRQTTSSNCPGCRPRAGA